MTLVYKRCSFQKTHFSLWIDFTKYFSSKKCSFVSLIYVQVYVHYHLMELCILGRKTTSIWRAWRTTQNECCRKIVDDFAHGWKHSRKDFNGLHWTNQEPPRGSSGQREIFEHNQKTYPSVSGLYGFQGRYSNTFLFQMVLTIPFR